MLPSLKTFLLPLVAVAVAALAGCSAAIKPDATDATTGSVGREREGASGTAAKQVAAPRDASERQETPAKVALLLPITGSGQAEPVAIAMRQAAELAVVQMGKPNVQLLMKDDKGTPEGAKAAATEAIAEGAEVILGPLFAKSVAAATEVARASKVPVVAFSSDRQAAGNGAWLVSFMPEQEVHRIIGYAAGQGRKRMAALVPGDAYGRLVEKAFREAAGKSGVQVVALETYALTGNGLMTGVRALKDRLAEAAAGGNAVDALFLPVAAEQLPQLANLIPHIGLDAQAVKILGAGGWEAADFANLPVFHGAWHAGADPRGWRDFSERFGKTYGLLPPRIAALADDAVALVGALSAMPKGERFTAETLTRPNGFMGVDGQFKLLRDGTSERSLAVLEVGRSGPTVLEGAAASGMQSDRYSGLAPRVN